MKLPTIIIALLALLFTSAHAYEPPIPGRIVADVAIAFPGGLVVDWDVKKQKRPKAGDVVAVEWGNGNYYAVVLGVWRNVIYTDYTPTSVEVDLPATVRKLPWR